MTSVSALEEDILNKLIAGTTPVKSLPTAQKEQHPLLAMETENPRQLDSRLSPSNLARMDPSKTTKTEKL